MFDYNNAFCPICKEKYNQIDDKFKIFLYCHSQLHREIRISICLKIGYAYHTDEKIIILERFSYDILSKENFYIDIDELGFCQLIFDNKKYNKKFSKIKSFEEAYENCIKIKENLIFM